MQNDKNCHIKATFSGAQTDLQQLASTYDNTHYSLYTGLFLHLASKTWSICGLLRGNVKSARRIRSTREQLKGHKFTEREKQENKAKPETSTPACSLECTKTRHQSLVLILSILLVFLSGKDNWKHKTVLVLKACHRGRRSVSKWSLPLVFWYKN